MGRFFRVRVGTLVLLGCLASPMFAQISAPVAAPAAPIRVKVVVVAMFEVGEDSGDTPGNTNYGSSASIWTRFFRRPPDITTCA